MMTALNRKNEFCSYIRQNNENRYFRAYMHTRSNLKVWLAEEGTGNVKSMLSGPLRNCGYAAAFHSKSEYGIIIPVYFIFDHKFVSVWFLENDV